MAIKKAIYKVDNGINFDEIYFKTSGDMIIFDNDKYYIGESCYNYTQGILMQTNIPSNTDAMVEIYITGNGYNQLKPIDTKICFYNYQQTTNSMLYPSGIANGLAFDIKAFVYNGFVCIWIPYSAGYQTFRFAIGTHYSISDLSYTLSNASMPTTGVNKVTTIVPKESATTEYVNSQISNCPVRDKPRWSWTGVIPNSAVQILTHNLNTMKPMITWTSSLGNVKPNVKLQNANQIAIQSYANNECAMEINIW